MLPPPFRVLSAAVFLGSAVLPAQCGLSWLSADPSPYLRGNLVCQGTWDPDGTGPLPARLLVGGVDSPTFSGGPLTGGDFSGGCLAAFDGTDWTQVPTPAGSRMVTAIGLVQGQTAIATRHQELLQGQTIDYAKISILTPGGVTVAVDHVRGGVNAITEYAGELVFAGSFTGIGLTTVTPYTRIARLTAGGTVASLGTGLSDSVNTLASYSGRLFAGGIFATAGGVAASNLAAWDGSTWAAVGNPNGAVYHLVVRTATTALNSHLFAGGNFTSIGGFGANGVARYNSTSNSWLAMSLAVRPCYSLAVRGTGLTGFELTATHGDHRAYRWNGTTWLNLDPAGPQQVDKRGLLWWNGTLVVREYSSTWPTRMRRFDGTTWPPLAGRGIVGAVRAALPAGGQYVIGGDFATISGTTVNGIASGVPGAWQPLGSGVGGGSVLALARLANGDLVAGGDFTTAGGQPATGLARWDGAAWQPFGGAGVIRTLAVLANGDLLAGGTFASIGGVAANHVARWNGSVWAPLGIGLGGATVTVRCCRELPGGELLLGGEFTSAGGVATKNVGLWNGAMWTGYGSSLTAPVVAVDRLASGEVLAWRDGQGGACTSCGADLWNGFVWSAVDTGSPAAGPANGTLLANGGCAATAAVPTPVNRAQIAYRAIPPNGSSTPWTVLPMVARAVHACTAAPNGDVLVCGDLDAIGPVGSPSVTTGSSGFVVLRSGCAATVGSVGAGCPGSTGTVAFTATQLPWLGGTYRATASGFAPLAIALEVLGVQAVTQSLAPLAAPGCSLHTVPDVTYAFVPANGAVSVALVIPTTPALLGFTLRDQFLQFEVAAGGGLGTVSASNALGLFLGSY